MTIINSDQYKTKIASVRDHLPQSFTRGVVKNNFSGEFQEKRWNFLVMRKKTDGGSWLVVEKK